MTSRQFPSALLSCGTLILVAAGCGTSGSSPVLFPEVRFEVSAQQGGPIQFMVQELVAGGARHTFPAGTTFAGTSKFYFFLENAAPPYRGIFQEVGDSRIEVHLFETGGRDAASVRSDSGLITVEIGAGTAPTVTPTTPQPEVRFDVCAPSADTAPCAPTSADSGKALQEFSGTVGDAFLTHLLGSASGSNPGAFTPAVYFIEGVRDSINGVFRSAPNSATLSVQLFVDGQLQQSASGIGDLVFRRDL